MGRNKIKIEKIKHDRIRQVTFYKRKKGLLKKAMELSLLCETEVLLCVAESNQNRCLIYSSYGNIQGFIENHIYKDRVVKEVITNNGYDTLFINEKEEDLSGAEDFNTMKEGMMLTQKRERKLSEMSNEGLQREGLISISKDNNLLISGGLNMNNIGHYNSINENNYSNVHHINQKDPSLPHNINNSNINPNNYSLMVNAEDNTTLELNQRNQISQINYQGNTNRNMAPNISSMVHTNKQEGKDSNNLNITNTATNTVGGLNDIKTKLSLKVSIPGKTAETPRLSETSISEAKRLASNNSTMTLNVSHITNSNKPQSSNTHTHTIANPQTELTQNNHYNQSLHSNSLDNSVHRVINKDQIIISNISEKESKETQEEAITSKDIKLESTSERRPLFVTSNPNTISNNNKDNTQSNNKNNSNNLISQYFNTNAGPNNSNSNNNNNRDSNVALLNKMYELNNAISKDNPLSQPSNININTHLNPSVTINHSTNSHVNPNTNANTNNNINAGMGLNNTFLSKMNNYTINSINPNKVSGYPFLNQYQLNPSKVNESPRYSEKPIHQNNTFTPIDNMNHNPTSQFFFNNDPCALADTPVNMQKNLFFAVNQQKSNNNLSTVQMSQGAFNSSTHINPENVNTNAMNQCSSAKMNKHGRGESPNISSFSRVYQMNNKENSSCSNSESREEPCISSVDKAKGKSMSSKTESEGS
mmetsp:Transcript_14942/g.15454  ORF Transcript_14942/g.15454 Transcript_14942/m.15454 type:complete len:705 (+) Transcript_14942:152-2266(+)